MGFTIEDGTGQGYSAQVNKKGKLQTESNTTQEFVHISFHEAQAYGTGIPSRTGTVTGGRYLYIKNTSATKLLHIQKIHYMYDGGATNSTKTCDFQIYWNDSAPSGNNTVGTAGNLNRASSNVAEVTVNYWDEVGDGMTTATPGTAGAIIKVGKGREVLEPDGAIILGNGDSISINAKPIEVGEINILISYYFKEHD